MANYKHYFNSSFAGCRCLAHAYDPHRTREVKIYQIPGELECVGVTDGVDKWVAPTIANPFSVDVLKILKDLSDGVTVHLPVVAPGYPNPGVAGKPGRRAVITDPEPSVSSRPRKQLLVNPGEPQTHRQRKSINL